MTNENTTPDVQGFDVTPHAQPEPQPEPQPTAPLVSFATTAPEPQQPSAAGWESIIEQQNAQIAALMAQNQALTGQITQMIQGGAQITQQAPAPQPQPTPQPSPLASINPPSLSDDTDYSLEALANEFSRR